MIEGTLDIDPSLMQELENNHVASDKYQNYHHQASAASVGQRYPMQNLSMPNMKFFYPSNHAITHQVNSSPSSQEAYMQNDFHQEQNPPDLYYDYSVQNQFFHMNTHQPPFLSNSPQILPENPFLLGFHPNGSMPPPYFPPNVPFSYDAYFEAMQRKKRRRRLGSDETKILVDAFETNPKPNASTRDSLAKKLKMTPRAIQIWFQNRRAKMKRDHSDVSSGLTFGTPTTSPATSTSSHLSPQDQPQQSISSIESRHNISPLEIEENSHESSVNLLFGQEEYQEMHDLAPLSRFLLEPQTSTSFESVRAGTGDNDTQNNLPFYRNSRYSDQINLDIFFDSRPVPLLNGDLDAKQQHGQSASPFLRNAFSDFMMSTMPLNKQSLEDLVANGPCTEL